METLTHPNPALSVMDAISERRSVRSYKPIAVDRVTVQRLLAAAVRAPTAIHEEPWAFVVVQDRELLKRISDRAKPLFTAEVQRAHLDRGGHALDMFMRPDFDIFYDASTLIVIWARQSGPFVDADCWLAAENLMLAACALGLGSCVIGSALAALNLPDVKAELGVPAEFSAIAPIIVGIPADAAVASPRREPEVLAWKQAKP